MEKSIKLTVRAGNTWKISRTIRNHADGVRALAAVEINLHKHPLCGGVLTCKTDNGCYCGFDSGYYSGGTPGAVLSKVEEFMKSAGLLPCGAVAYQTPAETQAYIDGLKELIAREDEREERAALEAARMQEIAYVVCDGLAHVRTVCDLLKQTALRARDMFGKSHRIVHTVLDPVIDAEDALQGMLHRLVIDAGELTDMLDAVADPRANAPSQTSDRQSAREDGTAYPYGLEEVRF